MEDFQFDPEAFSRPHAGDDSLLALFYMGVLRNDSKTITEGRPIFDDVESLKIIIPGDKNNIIDRPATEQDKRRFARQYAAFKQGLSDDEQLSGTRLNEWPFLSRAQCEELKHLGVRTVEQLAEVRDDIVSRVPGMHALKRHAGVWLGKTKTAAEAAKTAKLIEDQAAKIAALEEAVRDLGERNERLKDERARA